MGYTHYWRQQRSFSRPEWTNVMAATRRIIDVCKANDIRLVQEYDTDLPPVITDEFIQFNGHGEDGHETFYITRITPELEPWMRGESFAFCKTARKPYDGAVCLVLLAVYRLAPEVFQISSDGHWEEDWECWVRSFKTIFREKSRLSCPWGDTD